MASALDSFTQKDFEKNRNLLVQALSLGSHPVESPSAFLLGGQSGAGKTRLHKLCAQQLDGNCIVINGDEYRKSHPNFEEIQNLYGMDAPAHTAKWAGQMTEALIDAFSSQGYNLVIEGTLRTSEVPLRTATMLRGRGYSTSLAIMAVKPEVSLVSCQIRYEMMRIAGTTPRATDPEHHNEIVHDIVENLSTLTASGLFDAVLIYNRAGRLLFPTDEAVDAAAVLHDVLFGPWTPEEEEHYLHLQQRLEELKGMG